MSYWTDAHRHTEACYQTERGPDGAHRRIHRPEPCPPAGGECLHIGARPPACKSCGTTLEPEPATA